MQGTVFTFTIRTLNPSVGYTSLKCDSLRNVVRSIDLCVGG